MWPAKNDYVSAAVFGLHLKLSLYKAILKKIAMTSTCVWFCYLFNGICLHFHLCVTGIPADVRTGFEVLIGLVTLIVDVFISK